ncbi:MAG: DUF1192 domain-containing protein [Rhizobiales bacterium]|nr:DUF1192 domain-containing protein [Hyphomicrobiales bacterium]
MDEEEFQPRRKPQGEIIVGEDLSQFSIEELTIRLSALDEEKLRVEEAIKVKKTQTSQAESLFKTDG